MNKENNQKLKNRIRALPLHEGKNDTGILHITAYQFTTNKIQMPQMENPYLYIVLDGILRLHTPSGIMDYIAGQYSISKIDTPVYGTILSFSEQQDNPLMSVADYEVIESVNRLFSVMEQSVPSEFIHKNIMREIIYYILCGSCGRQFIQSIVNVGQADIIYEANSWIKDNFRNSFTVETLAEQRNMSVSGFHQKFKNAVGMGPLQCQKRLRLTEARRLMLDKNECLIYCG